MEAKETYFIDFCKFCRLLRVDRKIIQREFFEHNRYDEPPKILPDKFCVVIDYNCIRYYATRALMLKNLFSLQIFADTPSYQITLALFRAYHALMLTDRTIPVDTIEDTLSD